MVHYEKHRGVSLTQEGRKYALEVVRHHRLLELFLHKDLGYDLHEVHEEADRLEHAISERFEERVAERLGHPETDPHGDPIPRRDGSLPRREELCLAEAPVGTVATVSRVAHSDATLVRYLCELGIVPQARLVVLERAPFEGPLVVRLEGEQRERALGVGAARAVFLSGEAGSENGGGDRPRAGDRREASEWG